MGTLLSISLVLGVSFAVSMTWPFYWRRAALAMGLFWGLAPGIVYKYPGLGILFFLPANGGLEQLSGWPLGESSFLFLAWPLLMLAMAALGAYAGSKLSVSRRRRRGY